MKRGENVFEQIGFSPEESAALAMKAELHSEIVACAKQYTQAELQKILRESQPRISDLLRGKIANFSLETLVEYAEALQLQPELKLRQPVRFDLLKGAARKVHRGYRSLELAPSKP